jgi:hypothetical protein
MGLEPMSLAVDASRGLPVGRVDEAEHLAGRLVDPIVRVVDAVLALNADIGFVGTGDIRGGSALPTRTR